MDPSRDHHRKGNGLQDNRRRASRQSRISRHKGGRYDQGSVDSGYGGSSTIPSPRFAKYDGSRGRRHHDDDQGSDADDDGCDKDSDSDYDPKAKYYLTVDDDDYRNISFQGGDSSNQPGSRQVKGKRRRRDDDYSARRRRGTDDRHRSSSRSRRSTSVSSSASDSTGYGGLSRRKSSRRHSDPSARPRRNSVRRKLSPVASATSEDWHNSPQRRNLPTSRSSATSSDSRSPLTEPADVGPKRSPNRLRRPHTRARAPVEKDSRKRTLSEGGSSSYRGAADLDDAWYKTLKERLTNGVDMSQVKKVGLDAAAVAAVKVAVGTQIPWKQRIPKTIAVGLAAAVTDFIVSKTSIKPKGMVGTMYARQFVEIALANLIINPTSNKVTQKFGSAKKGQAGGQAAKNNAGTQSTAANAPRAGGGRGRR